MKGVESVIGGYLLLIVILAVISGFYTWMLRSSETINHQLSDKIDIVQYLSNPPALSIIYEKDYYYRLRVQPTIPIFIREVVVKSIQGELVNREIVNNLIESETDILIPITTTPVVIFILTDQGITYYYTPRSDPLLGNAPDHIRRKTYVDDELLEYIRQRNKQITDRSVFLLDTIGYKVLMGVVKTDPGYVVRSGPIQCPETSDQFIDTYGCNLDAKIGDDYVSFVTYQQNGRLWDYSNDGSLRIFENPFANPSDRFSYYYIQVLRAVRIVNKPSNITVSYVLRIGGGEIKIAYITPVYYVVQSIHRPDAPLILTSRRDNTLQWLHRVVLVRNPETPASNYITYTIQFTVDPWIYGYGEIIVLTGLEVIYRGYGELFFRVDVAN